MEHRKESDEFKSYSDKSEDEVDLMGDLRRPTRAVEERLFAIYQANVEKKRHLLERINEIESFRRQKITAKQLVLDRDRKRDQFFPIDSDEDEFEPQPAFLILRNDFEEKKKQMIALEANQAEYKKMQVRIYGERQLNEIKALRDILRDRTEVSQYLYLEKYRLITVLFSRRESSTSTVFFRSVGVPTSRLPSISLDSRGYKLFSAGKYLMIATVDNKFHLYDLDLHKLLVSSTVHDSAIEYVQLYKHEGDPNWSAVSVTKDGVARVFDLQKKLLKSVMICEQGRCFYLHEELLVYGSETKLLSVNILTKVYKEVLTLPDEIVSLTSKTMSTKNYHLNNYIEKGQFKTPEQSQFRLVTVGDEQAKLSSTDKGNVLNYKENDYVIGAEFQFIGSFNRAVPSPDEEKPMTSIVALWGDRRGQLQEMILE